MPRSYTPTPATIRDYRRMADTLGVQRAILVHPSVYGHDHTTFEDTLAANRGWLRGVAVVYPHTSDSDIERWHELAARVTRLNALFKGAAGLDDLPSLADRVRPFGWHLQLLIDVSVDPDRLARLADLGLPLVVDHFGHLPASGALQSAGIPAVAGARAQGMVDILAALKDGDSYGARLWHQARNRVASVGSCCWWRYCTTHFTG